MTAELESISRVRTATAWLRRTGKLIEEYPKYHTLSPTEIDDSKKFAVGMYPMPGRWTPKLYNLAKSG